MDIEDIVVFPYEKWNAVRSAASTIGKQFHSKFIVSKIGKHNEVGDISVKRVQ